MRRQFDWVDVFVIGFCAAVVSCSAGFELGQSYNRHMVCISPRITAIEQTEHGNVVRCVDIRGEVVK